MAAVKNTETAVQKSAPLPPPAMVIDYGGDVGAGFENQSQSDMLIPRLVVLQALSPQCSDREDCRPGMLWNTVTETPVSGTKGVVFVPATTKHLWNEWVPREKGGGMAGQHSPEATVVRQAIAQSREFGKYNTPNGNQLVETFDIYAVLLDENNQPESMAVISFTSAKIKVYKQFNTKLNMFTVKAPDGRKVRPPLFAHKVRLVTVKEKNNKGEFYVFDLQPADGSVAESLLPPGHAALEAAKELRSVVDRGEVKVADENATPHREAPIDADVVSDTNSTGWNA